MLSHRLRLSLVPALVAVLSARAPLAAQQVKRALSGTRPDSSPVVKPQAPLPFAATPKPGIGVIDGIVTDTNLVPLLGARVSILRTALQIATGPNGRFRIVDIPSGQYIVIVRRAGFHPTSSVLQVAASDTLRLSYMLARAPAELAPVIVTEKRLSARMKDFEYRRKLGFGEFMTQEQIEEHNPGYPTELLRLFSSISVQPTSGGGGEYVYYPVSARATGGMTSTGQAPCFMTVYLDNVPMPAPFNLDLLPSPHEIAGIEVYAGAATTPIQYAGLGNSCGIILVWTRDGVGESSRP